MNSMLENTIFDCGKAAAIAAAIERAYICRPDDCDVKRREEAEYAFYVLLDAIAAVRKDLDMIAEENASV